MTTATTTDGSWLSSLADWAVSLMDVIGPAGAGIAIAMENLFPPLPSEVILPMAGLAASRGSFSLVEALVWTTVGSIAGALLLYGLGAWLGSVVIAADHGFRAPSLVGAGLAVAGVLVFGLGLVQERRGATQRQVVHASG